MIDKKRRVLAAMAFSEQCHKGQVRKYGQDVPYITHPREVARMVSSVAHRYPKHQVHMVCAAHLHDVVEDCGVSLGKIIHDFGAHIGAAIYYLTDPPNPNRESRHNASVVRLMYAPDWVKEVRAADILHNTWDIVDKAPDAYVRMYLREKMDMLVRCQGKGLLWELAIKQVDSLRRKIGDA